MVAESGTLNRWRKGGMDMRKGGGVVGLDKKEAAKVIGNLMKACDELMAEGISKTRAADWALVCDALVEGKRALVKLTGKEGHALAK
jgi:hypothetical protein